SSEWVVRADEMFLIPGDSPMGYRLPLVGLLHEPAAAPAFFERDPFERADELPAYESLRRRLSPALVGAAAGSAAAVAAQPRRVGTHHGNGQAGGNGHGGGNSHAASGRIPPQAFGDQTTALDTRQPGAEDVIRTALCVEPRGGVLHVFMPPTDRLEVYLDLLAAIEGAAESLGLPIVVEGYLPPHDPRLRHIKVTPDPGVIEVNVHPAEGWDELVDITTGVYDDARQCRLGTEKFDLDGTHTGTGGGNHVVLGGKTPEDSPWLRRPDLLKSFLGYWQNHPSLSYLFSGRFIGPTSQAPRVEESRVDALYELKIAFEQIQAGRGVPPWLVDRVFRHLLTDGSGNTHRAEFCIDKLYSPDSATGRLGLLEFRAMEMPPHARMSLTQQLLLRTLVARFWQAPYEAAPVRWGSTLHDRWMLPHFIWQDFEDVLAETAAAGFAMRAEWFASHWEFRFPRIGAFAQRGVHVELRSAVEPWYVLGEENAGGATSRYVDSSVERLQVKVTGMTDPRHVLCCNGRRVPLHPTGVEGEYVAGVRYRAWGAPPRRPPPRPAGPPPTGA
ncbi:MAG: transglutaminase family protein, partial [Planctomycetota bacterium]